MTEKKKGIDLKKLMEAGALLAESRARGSSGGIASALQKSGIDLSGKNNPFNFQKTADAEGKALRKKIINPTAPDPLGEGKTDYYV